MSHLLIIAADRIIDGQGDHSKTLAIIDQAEQKNLKVQTLEIVDLATRWEDKLLPHQFKSGASAMAAIKQAQKLLAKKKADLIIIKGRDFLKTEYTREDREKFMVLYNKKYTPLEGYTKLVPHFLRHHGIKEKDFFKVSERLFENYLGTWNKKGNTKRPDDRWFNFLTKYFRGVDCANPNIDFSGQIIITSALTANKLKVPKDERIKILGNAFTKLNIDGHESIPKVATYQHLKKVITKAVSEAQIDFNHEFKNGRAAMDAYTCYPVVPMGLLLRMNLAKNAQEIMDLLKKHEVTVTGGLNLARAPWNLTSLNGLIEMREKIIQSKKIRYGLVHGNGSLGGQQGITILGK